jgi:hypothetical protein
MIEAYREINQTHSLPADSTRPSSAKWKGRRLSRMAEKLNPVPAIVNALAYFLFPLAARCVVFTSSRSFKKKCSEERLMNSRQTLIDLGGEEIKLPMPNGHSISAMYLDTTKALSALVDHGAQRGEISLPDGMVQEVLWIDMSKGYLLDLIDRMGLSRVAHENGVYVPLGIPRKSFDSSKDASSKRRPEAVIYAPGSGHLFEFRRKTIGTFVIDYGMNMLVLNYSGTGKSEGKISEEATYENMEAAYQYLAREKGFPAEQIWGYGHCMGSGPILHLAAQHPINAIVDRAYLNMGEFAKTRVIKVLHLPFFLKFLAAWIEPVMNKCFCYNNRENIQLVQGRVAVLGAIDDELIPNEYIPELFDKAIQAKEKIQLFMHPPKPIEQPKKTKKISTHNLKISPHDLDLMFDPVARLELGKFLAGNHQETQRHLASHASA